MAAKNAVATKKNELPVDYEVARQNELAAMKSRLSAPSGNKISLKKGMFVLPDGSTNDTITAVIVDFVSRNEYYELGYDEKNIVPPNCFAIGLEVGGLIPSENSPEVQAGSCAACWANQWKSARTGSGKACNNSRRLAILAPDADDDSQLMLLKVSPTALKNYDQYVATLGNDGILPREVVTTITLDQNLDYASLRFSNPQPASEALKRLAYSKFRTAREVLMQEPDVSAFVKKVVKGKAPVRKGA